MFSFGSAIIQCSKIMNNACLHESFVHPGSSNVLGCHVVYSTWAMVK